MPTIKKKIDDASVQKLKTMFAQCKNVVVTAHTSPDGDAMGSCMGMYEYLKRKGKNVSVVVPNYFPDFLHWMKDSDKVVLYDRKRTHANTLIMTADLIVCLDFNDWGRIDEEAPAVQNANAKKVLIDHHLNPRKAGFDVVISHPEASSTCELVWRVLDAMGESDNLTFAGAEDLYAGMYTDTGGFSFNSNNPDIFIILSELLKKGIDKDLINRRINNNFSPDRLRLIGYVLYEKLQVFPEKHASLFALSKEELAKFNYIKGDMEGIVNMPLQIKGHKLSIQLREDTEKPVIRVSTRSVDDVPCNLICEKYFNGGGHKNASGGTLECSLEEAIEIAKKAIEDDSLWNNG